MALITRFGAPIDPARFMGAVDDVVAMSDALRTTIREIDGIPHPAIASAPPAPCKLVRLDPSDLDQWMHDRLSVTFDLSKAAYDSVLLDLGDDSWAWWANVHHIVIDAGSSANFFNAVASRYHGDDVELPLYSDVWAELADGQNAARQQKATDAWALISDPVPTDFYRPDSGPVTDADRVSIDMSGGRQQALDELLADRFQLLSPDLSITVAMATTLAAYTARLGNEAVTIGVPIHHRSTKNAKAVIGPLVELFPLRIEVESDDTFATLQKRVSRSMFELLTSALPGTSPRQSFDLVLNVHAATFGDFGSVPASTRWIHPGHIDPHHRLRMQVLDYDGSGTLELGLDINHRIADADHRRRASSHLAAVLDAMLADPDRRVHSVPLVGSDEHLLLSSFTTPSPGTPIDGVAPDIISQRLKANANVRTLQQVGDAGLTELLASDLDAWIDEVATQLRRSGFGRGDLIGIEMPISLDAVVAIHGVQRAGAAFVPIDPAYPAARREHIRNDSDAALVLTSLSQLEELPVVDPEPVAAQILPDDLAYVIYTSGSTGLPKGVPITHQGLSEYLGFAHAAYVDQAATSRQQAGATTSASADVERKSRQQLCVPLFTSLSFDLTITTLYLPLLCGGLMTVHPEGGLPALRQIVDQRQATMLKATPSHLELLARMIDSSHPLRRLIVGGEAFMTDLADRLHDILGPELVQFNEYGPTEAVVGCMEHRYIAALDAGPEVPIGHPAPGVGLHILDRFGYPVPLGVAGELYISRPGLTSGYLGRDDLNAAKFVIQTGTDTTLYRTGDLVRMLDADRMVYLGRIDEQIKVGGIRLEPGEIEHIAQTVPGVSRAVAGLWSPDPNQRVEHCVECGLGSDVPEVTIDADGICSSCHHYRLVAPQAEAWFKNEDDLRDALADARERSTGDYDVVHLISGGKDSTYALYKLVELGARVFAITLDNGYIAEVAKANVRRATQALGVDHEFVTVDGMDEIFRDSLERFSNVCQGCYKAIYTIALAKAEELGIGSIVTGLSRGQFFETRLVPGMFESDRFDPDAIDEMVKEARHVYHATPDAVSEHMDVEFLNDETIFDRITFIDFYRYMDVELAEMYRDLEGSGTWQRPPDSGRSTNCLINAAGIFTHKLEQGHHNYAAPYSWDVRLGHKTRDEALYELDDPMDAEEMAAITKMLAEVGYEPRKPEVLTLWVEADDDVDLEALQAELVDGLPAHAVPQSIEIVNRIPLTTNGKVDMAALPAPATRRSGASADGRAATSDTELAIASIWSSVLGVAEVAATADFFAIGGTSLHALEMIVRVSDHFDVMVPESMAFTKRTVEELAQVIDADSSDAAVGSVRAGLEIPKLPEGEALPLSAGEESMLYEWRRDPSDMRYNVARLYRVPADFDFDRFNDAVRLVVAHQQALHTSYGPRREKLEINSALWISSAASEVASLKRLAEHINATQFDLVNGRLLSVHHLSSGHADDRDQHAVLLRAHHIVSDAGSLDVLWEQIDRAYQGLDLPELGATYAEHAAWQRDRIADPAEVWTPDVDVAELMVRGAGIEPDGYVHLESQITMTELRKAPATTPFATALTALAAAMRPVHDGDLLELAITSSVRDHPAIADVVGYFLNPLPLLVPVEYGSTLQNLADTVSSVLATGLEYRAVPFADIVRSARERGIQGPTGRVMLAVEDLAAAELDGVPVEHSILASGTAVNDLTFFVQIRGESIELGCEYRGSTIGREAAERLLGRFEDALAQLISNASVSVESTVERPEPLAGPAIADLGELVPQRISVRTQQTPNAVAVRSGGRSLTYAELDAEARDIAARLRAVGVSAGDRVAVVLPRSVDLVTSIQAVWMIGASYVPVDYSQPAARVTELISAAEVVAAISSGAGHAGLTEVTTIHVDRADNAVLPISRVAETTPESEAYVIFTSGSSGRPKGVPIRHDNLRTSLAARQQWYGETVESYLLISSASFDSSVAGLFWTLADGGQLVIPTEDEVHDVDALLALITAHGVTHTLMVPSLYAAVLQRSSGELSGVRTVIVAGEACPPSLVASHVDVAGSIELINEYGPTEATVWATAHRCGPADGGSTVVPIGAPIPAMTASVVDAHGAALPLDTAGELWLNGAAVALGYLNDVEADRFIISDDSSSRTYRTGDLVVRRADDTIDFLGRIDSQLSVGGVRIEPAEIEQSLASLPGVQASLVGVVDSQLVAWVELADGSDGSSEMLRTAAAEILPATHVPQRVMNVPTLPRNANGKVDRKRIDELPARVSLSTEMPERSPEGSTDPVVARVVEIYSAAFDDAPIDATTDFFDAGGDSLRAVALVSLLEAEFGRRVAIGELIDAPTPIELAARLRPSRADNDSRDDEVGDVGTREASSNFNPSEHHSDLVEMLRSSGSETPLVVLPPGGGNLLRYAPLVRALDADVPVVGIRLPGADARSEIVDSIADQAAVMLDALDTAMPHGPYRLLGWSTGGLLVWEMARLLKARGDDVEKVILVDTVMAGLKVDDTGTITDKYRDLLRNDGVVAVASEGASRLRERASFAVARRRYRNAREAGAAPSLEDAERQLGPVIRRAALGYTPQPLDVPVVYVGASESDNSVTHDPWSELQGDLPFTAVEIEGVHFQPEARCIIGVNRAAEFVASVFPDQE